MFTEAPDAPPQAPLLPPGQVSHRCPDCGGFYTVHLSDNSYECFACRRITYHEDFRIEPDFESCYLQDIAGR